MQQDANCKLTAFAAGSPLACVHGSFQGGAHTWCCRPENIAVLSPLNETHHAGISATVVVRVAN